MKELNIQIQTHFVRERILQGMNRTNHVFTKDQLANILTKSLRHTESTWCKRPVRSISMRKGGEWCKPTQADQRQDSLVFSQVRYFVIEFVRDGQFVNHELTNLLAIYCTHQITQQLMENRLYNSDAFLSSLFSDFIHKLVSLSLNSSIMAANSFISY